MVNKDITFVAGVHGVGKSTLCVKLASMANLTHLSASDLIRRRKELDKNKKVINPLDNQEILVQELMNYPLNNKLLLDGHFCLLDMNERVIKLPIELYKNMEISKILLLRSEAELIYKRVLIRDYGKSGLSLKTINDLQDAEMEHAYRVSEALDIPLLEINVLESKINSEIKKILKFI
ncbi:ATP-binding protein [Acinetobacter junii]|uniref:ATP-binding protein n=1 Tax=Acinetobacter junii TaxID=40215 RepID=UPI00143B739D|nr:ATP-binding protein [Acinetobacter junii]